MRRRHGVAVVSLAVLAACGPTAVRSTTPAPNPLGSPQAVPSAQLTVTPKLVLQITVDQLGAEVLARFLERFGSPGLGFGKLTSEGTWFSEAYYVHASTETAVGHATLFTGALPRDHGIVGNEWFDLNTRKDVYAINDPDSPLVGAEGWGRSARQLLVPTVGDVLLEQTQGKAMVVSVSEKDRAAILPAGHKGRAYWLDEGTGSFITSRYHGTLPAWLEARKGALSPEPLRGQVWSLTLDAARYTARDDVPWERPFKHLGRVFPHPLTPVSHEKLAANAGAPTPIPTKDFVRGLKYTPFGDELVLAFVRELFANEPIGSDEVPDLLAVSFSSTDYVGHAFGPESRESEDNFVRLDRTVDALVKLAEERATRERLLVVLSADHGVTGTPEWWLAQGADAGRVEPEKLVARMNAALRKRLSVKHDLVVTFVNPSLWLDEARIAELGLTLADVEHALVQLVQAEPGVLAAFSRSDALAGALDQDELGKRIAFTTHPQRSGHVYLVPKEHWMLSTGHEELAATHGSPWPRDSHVPIVFWGMDVPERKSDERVDVRSVAPTVSAKLSIPRPSGASAEPLPIAAPGR